jgi:biotin transport system ATP-binding protein
MIETRNLVHRRGDTVAVNDVSLAIADGEYVLLAGPNGAGKTTLVRHFNGLLEPDRGEVLVNDTPVEADPVAARTRVGMVFQNPRDSFVAATVGGDVAFGPENLGLPRPEIDRRVDTALDAVNMTGRRKERIDGLSGGERARVAVAGALAMEPDHLVLDEPFGSLDWSARQSVMDRLASLSEAGTGMIVVTHDLRDHLDVADRVIVMNDGSIALDAPPGGARSHLGDLGVRPC